ncbi:transcription initiation factor IIF/Rap30 like winged HTH [Cryptosporidium canis]|uniref:Transcription initiation factor IIF/Rap30 like winged HTH n=1 Tax=Cryptosporidium canis TaxID=195482 RepID=A0ABQ8P7G0_9CRYT|nr:transcription initiation factor IIF/Rap30 like winged HTH [Cryptosporidium canis]KAJ1615096.1 transcription initiation factor IIF/Rap30 like winged HTH [Cryptosporidium canis]
MELSLCFENQMIIKLPSSIMEKIRERKPGEVVGSLKYDEDGKREWEILSSKLSETKSGSTETDSTNQNEKSGYLFVNTSDKKDKISMYPSQIHTLVRKGNFITDDIRRRIQEKTKKSSTVEDTKRIVGAMYESSSQPFMYYDIKTDQVSDDPRGTSINPISRKRAATSISQSLGTNEGNTNPSIGPNPSTNSISNSSLESLKENIFKIFEEKGSDGVSLKEIEDKTMKPKHIVKKIVEEIAVQAGRGGRRHIWHLKPQFIGK